jgi:type IV secretory pathway VirB2 component (pilin)
MDWHDVSIPLDDHLRLLQAERDKAVVQALTAINERLANQNEWRATMNDIVKVMQGKGMGSTATIGWIIAGISTALAIYQGVFRG